MPDVVVDGATIHYESEGEGAPLVLLSGLGAAGNVWAPVQPKLSGYRVITIDNRGIGQARPDGPFSIDDMADDVAAVIEAAGTGPCHCVGWSMGGSILQSLLIRHPDVVDRAVLLSTRAYVGELQEVWLRNNLALRRSGADVAALVIASMAWSYTPRTMTDHAAVMRRAELAQQQSLPTTLAGYEAQVAALEAFDSRSDLHRVSRPVLVLVGAEDILTPVERSVELAELIPGAHLRVLPRGGHGMIMEYPDDTLAAAIAFLDGSGEARARH